MSKAKPVSLDEVNAAAAPAAETARTRDGGYMALKSNDWAFVTDNVGRLCIPIPVDAGNTGIKFSPEIDLDTITAIRFLPVSALVDLRPSGIVKLAKELDADSTKRAALLAAGFSVNEAAMILNLQKVKEAAKEEEVDATGVGTDFASAESDLETRTEGGDGGNNAG